MKKPKHLTDEMKELCEALINPEELEKMSPEAMYKFAIDYREEMDNAYKEYISNK